VLVAKKLVALAAEAIVLLHC